MCEDMHSFTSTLLRHTPSDSTYNQLGEVESQYIRATGEYPSKEQIFFYMRIDIFKMINIWFMKNQGHHFHMISNVLHPTTWNRVTQSSLYDLLKKSEAIVSPNLVSIIDHERFAAEEKNKEKASCNNNWDKVLCGWQSQFFLGVCWKINH